jgi:hypothetical protein
MITTDTFTNFARRLAATRGCPYVVIAETPNPIRQLDDVTLRERAQAMIDIVIEGLTQPPDVIRRRLQKTAVQQIRPEGMVRAAMPV